MSKKFFQCTFVLIFFVFQSAFAQMSIDLPGVSIRSGKVDVQGITIVNGKLWIDNDPVPHGKKFHTSSKTGKTYKIEWGKDNNIAVSEASK